MSSIGEALAAKKSRDVAPGKNDVSIFLQLVSEQKHPLDLVRELLSNAGSKEVGATKVEISYTRAKEGHIFEITDNGVGMIYTGNDLIPGRLDKFLGLGLSSIVGMEGDEFSWKGLGSKLAYQSRRVEIETCAGAPNPTFDVRINEPWETLNRREIPHAKITEHPPQQRGTRIQVVGHPPHDKSEPFTFEDIKSYLLHRTFAGFTRERKEPPQISLSVLGQTEELTFGFPEFRDIDFGEVAKTGLLFDKDKKTLFVNIEPKSHKDMRVRLKGFLTWRPSDYDLSDKNRNTGLIFSVKGIPYFDLDLEEYGATSIPQARPGKHRTCLVLECDDVHDVMNISRSALVNHPKTDELKRIAVELFRRIETSDLYLGEGGFRRLPEIEKFEAQGGVIAEEKRKIEMAEQTWVVLEKPGSDPLVLLREPQSEMEVNALLWKLEALGALPFETFQTLAYIGAAKGPDLLVNFQEDKAGEASRATVIEVELNFYNYKTHGHIPPQYPKVICWDVPTSGRKAKIEKVKNKAYKYFLPHPDGYVVQIYVIKNMESIKVMSREELGKRGVKI
jgi:hypothetical protein